MYALFAVGFSQAFLHSLCWTLVHSLWLGMIAAMVTAMIITMTRRSSARLRYNLFITVLAIFVLSIIITAYLQFQSQTGNETLASLSLDTIRTSTGETANNVAIMDGTKDQHIVEGITSYLNEHASTIVLLWFVFFLLKCAQLISGLQHVNRIRHRNNSAVSTEWKNRLDVLARQTGINTSIAFLQSALISVPAVIGFLKPVLLVPAGLLSNLPPEQVEAILLHELAHIRRKDFLVNLLQSILETFFFFNPAIIWISSLIREEREACCDDMVIAGSLQKANYLQALVSFQELHLHCSEPAMALTGNKNYLLNRVKRMLTQENKKLNLMEKTALLLGIIGITAFSFISKEANEPPGRKDLAPVIQTVSESIPVSSEPVVVKKAAVRKKKNSQVASAKNLMDTVPKPKQTIGAERSFPNISSNINKDGSTIVSQTEATDKDGNKYRIKRVDGKITELVANGKTVPENQYGEYDGIIRGIDETQRQNSIKRKEAFKVRQDQLTEKRRELSEKRVAMNKAMQKERIEKMHVKSDSLKMKNFRTVEDRKLLFEKKMELKKSESRRNKEVRMQKQKLHMEGRKTDDVSRIISDLEGENLVTDRDNLSFSLDSKQLMVNGARQPGEIFQRFKEKYIQREGDRYNYSKHGGSTTITINRD